MRPSASLAAGSYPLTVTATSGGTTRTVSVTLVVTALDYIDALSLHDALPISGFETSYEVTATLVPGGTTPVTTGVELAVSGCPAGVNCFFNRGVMVRRAQV